MLETKDAARILDTILSIPGMSDAVKIDFKISRKQVLLLTSVIERGLSATDGDAAGLLASVPKESLQELTTLAAECLEKAGLTELNTKLKALHSK